jgi:sensor histidine kinase regulating citrate/malate metabolism
MEGAVTVPQDLFDSVADNLLTNALRKRQSEPWVSIEARLTLAPALAFSVIDSGSPAPEHVARNLFQSPVSSESGLGVGLYQAARQAARLGFQLGLTDNLPGQVVMSLVAMGSHPE